MDKRPRGYSTIKISLIKLFLKMIFASAVLQSCHENSSTRPFQFEIIYENNRIFIVDQPGKKWEITHAVQEYGFVPEKFDHGLGPNAITPINNPEFYLPGETGYPKADDRQVIGYSYNNMQRAYALNILVHHEIVNEWFDNKAVAVAYCPLIGLTAVYNRNLFGEILEFSASGWTYENTFVLYDYQSESLWYHLPGDSALTCISGSRADTRLNEFTSSKLRWSDWLQAYPESHILKSPH